MYDVKTGRGFSSFTVIKYRLRTGSDSSFPYSNCIRMAAPFGSSEAIDAARLYPVL